MTQAVPASAEDPDAEIAPEILAIIRGLAQRNARRDYAAAQGSPDHGRPTAD